MLSKLRITNYALIEHLEINFRKGFTVITGETGAGKSILLGALGLSLGSRADTNVLFDKQNKCVVEAVFQLQNEDLKYFFNENDLDFDQECILRREISPNAKSRAFINDSPVNLNTLKELGQMLVDIHSQHDSLQLTQAIFQLNLVDEIAGNDTILAEYQIQLKKLRKLEANIAEVVNQFNDAKSKEEFLSFQYNELNAAALQADESETLTEKLEVLTHSEEIRNAFYSVTELINRADLNAVQLLKDSLTAMGKVSRYSGPAAGISERLQSILIELKDIATEAEQIENQVNYDPAEIEKIQQRLSLIRTLLKKHQCGSEKELLELKDLLGEQLQLIESGNFNLDSLHKEKSAVEQKLIEKSKQLTQSRSTVIPAIERSVTQLLSQLGMPNARFIARMDPLRTYSETGIDNLRFLFSANKGLPPEDISRIASGGEISRLMLAIKSLTTGKKSIPTIVFDEIDTGVSGEIAAKVGRIMAGMAQHLQLIAITHLPQIAGKASSHLHVFKREDEKRTKTMIIYLSDQQRIDEVARMLSDDHITEAARQAARELISGF